RTRAGSATRTSWSRRSRASPSRRCNFMRALSARELLQIWERGLEQNGPQRAVELLRAAAEDGDADAAELTLGQRDARLLRLREWTFGREIAAVTPCPACGGTQELRFGVDDVRVRSATAAQTPLEVCAEGYAVRFRLPDSRDLGALAGT